MRGRMQIVERTKAVIISERARIALEGMDTRYAKKTQERMTCVLYSFCGRFTLHGLGFRGLPLQLQSLQSRSPAILTIMIVFLASLREITVLSGAFGAKPNNERTYSKSIDHASPSGGLVQLIRFCTLVPRFSYKGHKHLMTTVSLSGTKNEIIMPKMTGDLDGLLGNAELMSKVPKAKLMM